MDENKPKRVVDVSTLAYDLNAIMDFVFANKNKTKTNEIKEIYEMSADGALKLVQKAMTENKVDDGGTVASVRYDLVKSLMERVNDIIMDDYVDSIDGDDEPMENLVTAPMIAHLGDTFAINTLLREGMLVNMDLNEFDNNNE